MSARPKLTRPMFDFMRRLHDSEAGWQEIADAVNAKFGTSYTRSGALNSFQRARAREIEERENRPRRASPSDAGPLYDPRRDPEPRWDSLTAVLCGDPPMTRSALYRKQMGMAE